MIEVKPELYEVFESEMALESEENNVERLFNTAVNFVKKSMNEFERIKNSLSFDKLEIYDQRISGFGNVAKAFQAIKQRNPTLDIIERGVFEGKRLYKEINLEYTSEWTVSDLERKAKFLSETLIPILLQIRFLERYLKKIEQETPEIIKLAFATLAAFQNNPRDSRINNHCIRILHLLKNNPKQVWDLPHLDVLGTSFRIMIGLSIFDDDVDDLQIASSIGYLILTRLMELEGNNNSENINERILLVKKGFKGLQYTIMALIPLSSWDISRNHQEAQKILKCMEFSDLHSTVLLNDITLRMEYDRYITLLNQKKYDPFAPNPFYPNNAEQVIEMGKEYHIKLYNLIKRKVIDENTLDFSDEE